MLKDPIYGFNDRWSAYLLPFIPIAKLGDWLIPYRLYPGSANVHASPLIDPYFVANFRAGTN